jgi:hypothetical protein
VLKELHSIISDNQREKENMDKIKSGVSLIKEDFSAINSVFLENNSTAYFLEELASLASQDGLNLKILSVSKENNKDLTALGLNYVDIKGEVYGDFNDLYNFINTIENYKYKTEITRLMFLMDRIDNTKPEKVLKLVFQIKLLEKSE